MTIDRLSLWVAMSLLGFGSTLKADDEIPAPKPQAEAKAENVGAAPALPVFGWAHDRDLPIFDFAEIPGVLNDKTVGNQESSKNSPYAVSAKSKPESKKDREIEHYARLFRIWTFESFQHDSQEYRRRITTAQNMLRVWEYEGSDEEHRDALKYWFHHAALASAAHKSLPECEFLNSDLLAQAEAGIAFTPKGGPRAGIAFVRAMVRGSVQWIAPQGYVAKALTTPLPFDLPDPALVVEGEPTVAADGHAQSVEPVAELEISPAQGDAIVSEPAKAQEEPAKPIVTP
jgi:hypothetical protein